MTHTPFHAEWKDYPDTTTPITAAAIQYIEAGITAAAAGGAEWPSSAQIAYVDYVDGSDSNSGLSPGLAYKTIQAAYDDLVVYAAANHTGVTPPTAGTIGVGQLVLLPGAHDVGTGVEIDYRYPAYINGMMSGAAYSFTTADTIIYSSSSAVTEFVNIGSTVGDAAHITYGNIVEGATFRIDPAVNTTLVDTANFGACIRANSCDYLRVNRCSTFVTDATAQDVPLLVQEEATSNGDQMLLRLTDNICRSTPLYWARAAGGGVNLNRSLIGWNAVIFGAGATYPMVWLEGEFWNSTVIGNNLEGGASGPAISLGSVSPSHAANGNSIISNSGEAATTTYPFIHVVRGSGNIFIGGHCINSNGTNGTFIQFEANGYANTVINRFLSIAGSNGSKSKIIDNSTYPAHTQFYGRDGRVHYVKTGSEPTFSSSDFLSKPADGSIVGGTYDSDTGQKLLWTLQNGAYESVNVGAGGLFKSEAGATWSDDDFVDPPADGARAVAHDTTTGIRSSWVRAAGVWVSETLTTPITRVQKIGTGNPGTTGVSSVTATVAAQVTAGNHIILVVGYGGTNTRTVSVADDSTESGTANSYQQDVDFNPASDTAQHINFFSCYVTRNLAIGDVITVTFSGTVNIPKVAAYEYSGLKTTSWFDVSSTDNETSEGLAWSTGATAAVAQPSELLISAVQYSYTGLIPTGLGSRVTSPFVELDQLDGAASASRSLAVNERMVSGTAAYTSSGTFTNQAKPAAVIATYKAA